MPDDYDPNASLLDDYFGSPAPEWVPDEPEDGRPVITVPVPKLYEDSLYGAPCAVRVDQGTGAWLRFGLYSGQTGAPIKIEIGSYSTPPNIDVRFREASGYDPRVYVPDDDDTPSLATDGRSVLLPLPLEIKNQAGVYTAQVRVTDGNEIERNRSTFFVIVDRGLWLADGSHPNDLGPPTYDELRTAIRDHPGANRLLQNFEYFLGEVAQALVGGVQLYNTTFPLGSRNFSTINWPSQWRRQLIDGALAHLFETASAYFRRGHLPYNAAGVAIDDLDKHETYGKSAEMYRTRFKEWATFVKTKASIDSGWGGVTSGNSIW